MAFVIGNANKMLLLFDRIVGAWKLKLGKNITRYYLPKGLTILAELLCGRRPQKWSPIPILRGMLVIFYGHGKRNGSRARAPYIHTYIRTYIAFHDILT